MRRTCKIIWKDIRWFLNNLSQLERLVFLLVWLFFVLRVVFPVKHMANGYVIYLDPIFESEVCLKEGVGCDVDVSRTFLWVGLVSLTVLGLGYLNRRAKLAKKS